MNKALLDLLAEGVVSTLETALRKRDDRLTAIESRLDALEAKRELDKARDAGLRNAEIFVDSNEGGPK